MSQTAYMYKTLLTITLLVLISLTSCINFGNRVEGNGKFKTETRSAKEATKIKVLGGIDVIVEAGKPSIRIEGDENLLQYIETDFEGSWLEIKTKEHYNIKSKNPIKVYITTPSITDVTLHGSGNVVCNDNFSSGKNMSFEITGSGDITCMVNAPKIDADIAGSGNLHIAGETRDVDIQIAGSGNFDGAELKAENVVVDIAGSGSADVFADVNLNAEVSGSGDIRYRGKAVVNKDIAGSGSVSKLD